MNKLMILMRGVPGCGKSFQSKLLSGGDPSKVFSTDDWFERQEGGYRANWKAEKLYAAHRWNQDRVQKAIHDGVSPVIVDNTNLQAKLVRVYYDMAVAADYEVHIEEAQSPWWKEIQGLLTDRQKNALELKKWAGKLAHGFDHEGTFIMNEHGVPSDTIHSMLLKYHAYTVEELAGS